VEKVNSGVGAGDQRREVLQLNGEREDVREGRRFLVQTLIHVGWDDRVDDASLLLSELLANVTLHARTGCSVVVAAGPDVLRVEVEDGSPVLPRVQNFAIDTTTGRGLHLVERLSESWGTERTPGGKKVWFCLEHASPESQGLGAVQATGSRATIDVSESDLDALLEQLGASEEDGPALLLSELAPVL
jgi:anti-sigma regulatory factor (Ser/Thr protein kinase)